MHLASKDWCNGAKQHNLWSFKTLECVGPMCSALRQYVEKKANVNPLTSGLRWFESNRPQIL